MKKLAELIDAARAGRRRRLIAAYAQDSHTLEAVNDAVEAGIADVTLIGDSDEIGHVCRQEGIDVSRFKIVHETSDVRCVEKAVRMVSGGEGDVLMKGLVSTDKYMRGILNKEWGLLPPKGVLSHVAVMEIPAYHKLLVISDIAIIPNPDIGQKAAIAVYLRRVANTLGVARPRIAFIAPTEVMSPGLASCVDAAILSKMGDRGQLGDVEVDGPLSVDIAISHEVAQTKKFRGNGVAGDADCMLFPNLDSANVFFKACTKFAGAELAGIVAGTSAPCVLTSRGDTRASKLYSIALACLSVE